MEKLVLLSIHRLAEIIEAGDISDPKTVKALYCASQMVPSIVRFMEHKDVAEKLEKIELALKESKLARETYTPIIEDLFDGLTETKH